MKTRLLVGATSLVFSSGCAMSTVRTTTTTFHAPGHEARGSIVVVSAEENGNNSLEFQTYKSKIEAKLIANGYVITNEVGNADFVAVVSYGIDSGKASNVAVPIFGQTGGGTTFSSGTVYGSGKSASYSGTTYTMPTYGVVGTSNMSVTNYTRAVAIDVLDKENKADGSVTKKYELRAKSTGSCGSISAVFDPILEAMFKDFPGTNGKSKTIEIPAEIDC